MEAGYNVVRIDLPQDVRLLRFQGKAHGILAAPPCTVFSLSGNRWQRSEEDMREGLSVVDACLRIVLACDPVWWALENPVGKLSRYLGPAQYIFHPYYHGDPWRKWTALWGDFTIPQQNKVEPTERGVNWRYSGKQSALRSVTPPGFARAFFEANP